jgi:putative addiction module killer protein
MESKPRIISIFAEADGRQPYVDWIRALKDKDALAAIQDRLGRVEAGNFGDCARYGAITELRVHVGPGYRVYVGEDGPKLVILLAGSNKAKQTKGFRDANKYWLEYKGGKK